MKARGDEVTSPLALIKSGYPVPVRARYLPPPPATTQLGCTPWGQLAAWHRPGCHRIENVERVVSAALSHPDQTISSHLYFIVLLYHVYYTVLYKTRQDDVGCHFGTFR